MASKKSLPPSPAPRAPASEAPPRFTLDHPPTPEAVVALLQAAGYTSANASPSSCEGRINASATPGDLLLDGEYAAMPALTDANLGAEHVHQFRTGPDCILVLRGIAPLTDPHERILAANLPPAPRAPASEAQAAPLPAAPAVPAVPAEPPPPVPHPIEAAQ